MPSQPELRAELLARVEVDQLHRRRLAELAGPDGIARSTTPAHEQLFRELGRVDEENTAWMQGVVARHGWPTPAMVDDVGADAAWLLVQHADRKPAQFLRRCGPAFAVATVKPAVSFSR